MSKFKWLIKKIITLLAGNSQVKLPSGCSSYPFISGDTFLSLASCNISERNGELLINSRSVKTNIKFINVDLFNNYDLREIVKPGDKLIIHNGDATPSMEKINALNLSNITVFSTNLKYNQMHMRAQCIPIGIENAHWGRNGSLSYFNGNFKNNQKKDIPLLVSFSTSTNSIVRENYKKVALKYGYENNTGLDLDQYREMLSRSLYVLSPPGNGIDCHRTWEAIYHKSIPVLERKYWLFENLDLPVFIVDKIEDFFLLTSEMREKLYSEIIKKDSSSAYFDYWIRIINGHDHVDEKSVDLSFRN